MATPDSRARPSLHTETIIYAIDPGKDVDGLHPHNAGRLAGGFAALSPCTPLGCIILTKSVHPSLESMNAIVIGRSNLVGRPLVQLLLNENATVTIAHSRSRDLPDITLQQIQHFFEHYKDLEPGKWVKVLRWGGTDDAHRLITESIARAKK